MVEVLIPGPAREHPLILQPENVRLSIDGAKVQTRRLVKPGVNCHFGSCNAKSHVWDLDRAWFDPSFGGYLKVPFAHKEDGWEEDPAMDTVSRLYPRWSVGDRLWCKEVFGIVWITDGQLVKWPLWDGLTVTDVPSGATEDEFTRAFIDGKLRVDPDYRLVFHDGDHGPCGKGWRSPLFMPRWASRLLLEVTAVRAERVSQISEGDAFSEGMYGYIDRRPSDLEIHDPAIYRKLYRMVWNSLHAGPKPVRLRGSKQVDHYVSYPFNGEAETKTYRGKPWHVKPNPWVWCLTYKRIEESK